MRRFIAIARTTALEAQSEPIALLLAFGSVVMTTLATLLHFHQFGEPARMARDAGLSSVMVFGILHSVFLTIRVFRREIETGTMQMALARSVSRAEFFTAKLAGSVLSSLVFLLVSVSAALVAVGGAEVGGAIAARKGDIARIWGVAVALNVAIILVPLLAAAALNRFRSTRFTATAFRLAGWTALAADGVMFALAVLSGDPGLRTACFSMLRFLSAAAVAAMTLPVFAAAAAAFSVRFRDNVAATLCGILFLVSLPALSNYYLTTSLAKGGCVPSAETALAAAAALPFAAGFVLLGLHFLNNRDAG